MSNTSLEAIVGVAGDIPGTGASTLSKALAEFFKIYRFSAIRRVIALAYSQEIEANHQNVDERQLFENIKNNLLENPDYIDNLMSFNRDLPLDEAGLANFNQAADIYDQNHSLEVVIDGWLIKKLIEVDKSGHGGVFDAKLAVLLDKIQCRECDNFGVWPEIINSHPSLSMPFIRIALTVSAEESVERILAREQKGHSEQGLPDLSEEEINLKRKKIAELSSARIDEDWQRYGANYVHADYDTSLSPDHLKDNNLENLIVIDTSGKTPEQVEIEALENIGIKLKVFGGFDNWIMEINQRVEDLKLKQKIN